MTTGASGPDVNLVHGFRSRVGEEDSGEAQNPETHTKNISLIII